MILVLSMCAALWGIGAAMGAPKRQRWIMIGALFAIVIALHLILPVDHPVRLNTGGSAALWAMIAAFGAIVMVYRQGLNWLRARHRPPQPETPKDQGMGEAELNRYARHIFLREIGGVGQNRLRAAKVLIIGAGGLGSPVGIYLAASGVGMIGIVDDDVVDASNLQRQVIHHDSDLGRAKVESAADQMKAINPYVSVRGYHARLDADMARDLIAQYDLVIDGTDNFETRFLVNAACVATQTPLISGALSQWEGQISLFDATRGPCYQCIFPKAPAADLVPSCAEAGVFAPLPGIIGTIMAGEAVKHITQAGQTLQGRLMIHDALDSQSRVINLKKRDDCLICGGTK